MIVFGIIELIMIRCLNKKQRRRRKYKRSFIYYKDTYVCMYVLMCEDEYECVFDEMV